MGVTYDTGALIAADRGNAACGPATAPSWPGKCPLAGAGGSPVLARRRPQALLARLLAGCDVETLDDDQARSVSSLAARAATTDIVDACVVEGAMRRHDLVVSSDEADLQAIAAAVSHRLEVDRP